MIQVVTILYRSRALIPPSSLPFLRLSVEGLFEIVSTPSFLSRRFRSFLFLIPTPLQSGPFSSPPNPSPVMAFRSRTLSKEEILRLRSEHLPPNLTLHCESSGHRDLLVFLFFLCSGKIRSPILVFFCRSLQSKRISPHRPGRRTIPHRCERREIVCLAPSIHFSSIDIHGRACLFVSAVLNVWDIVWTA